MQEEKSSIYNIVKGYVPEKDFIKKNKNKSWSYGYHPDFDLVVISKTGEIGEIYNISGLIIALPPAPKDCFSRHKKSAEQYWERETPPPELNRIKSIQQWNQAPVSFKNKWASYIDKQFELRENGFWFMNNGRPTYITGSHWFYLQCASIDVGYPDFREANRIFWIFWEACKADSRSFGMIYVKIRRSGFSFMASSEGINTATLAKNSKIGILSKTGDDAKEMFTEKVVPINNKLPFYFKPIMEGMDKPKTQLSYKVPATKITKNNMFTAGEVSSAGLDTTLDWASTEDNSYDGQKLKLLIHDESGKWIVPKNIINNWRVTKTCLRLGGRIDGKCMMGSTVNALKKGGGNFKKIFDTSDVNNRDGNGQTTSGLYALFIPMEWNYEGYIDRYGMPVFHKPKVPVMGVDGTWIRQGAIDYWQAEADSFKNDPDGLNEHYRQFPRTTSHAFRDESKSSLFNLTKIYQQIDYNDSLIINQHLTRGTFHWKNGVKDTEVVWTPDPRGRFLVSWLPKKELQNRVLKKGDLYYPLNEHIGALSADPYDISAVVSGGGSKGAISGKTKFHMEDAPSNAFFLEYVARPQTAEIFFEEVLMACVFYGMPILIENNKPRLLYHFKHRGYRPFSLNRPDKHKNQLSKTELELGGIPNNSEDIKQAHASAIESYIEKYVGFDMEGTYRDPDEIGNMPFNTTLQDWAAFDIDDRGKFDISIASGLAIMANQKSVYLPEVKAKKLTINMAQYSNEGNFSQLIRKH